MKTKILIFRRKSIKALLFHFLFMLTKMKRLLNILNLVLCLFIAMKLLKKKINFILLRNIKKILKRFLEMLLEQIKIQKNRKNIRF